MHAAGHQLRGPVGVGRHLAAHGHVDAGLAGGRAQLVQQATDGGRRGVQQRRDEIRERIQALSPEQKRALIDEALSHLGRQGLLNAVVSRRAAQGDILHGMLGATVVRIYGEREYGPDWNKKAPEGDLFSQI